MTAATRLVIVTGPTASGKGTLARALSERLGGEIVSVDSMKVYRELDVVTAKPTAVERRTHRYHLLDLRDPHEDFSVGEYLDELLPVLADIRARGRWAILCGGTALYLKAFLEGFEEGPPADWELRRELIAEAGARGVDALHDRLRQLDPAAAERIQRGDLRRVVRALEVVAKGGTTGNRGRTWKRVPPSSPYPIFGIARDRERLYARIDERVRHMVERGLFEEIARLQKRTPPVGRSAAQCIGYKEVREGLASDRPREEIAAAVQQASRRFAKRQLTWFRKFPVHWLAATAWSSPEEQADEILARLDRAPSK